MKQLLALLVLAFSLQAQTADAKPPNIVLLLTDDHPCNEYGFMGSKVAHTPNIDRLASQSLRFPQGYVTTPVCRPSLGTLLTGRYPHETGIVFNKSPRAKEDNNAAHLITKWPTLPGMLGRAGYASLQTGKHWEADYKTAGFTEGTSAYTAEGKRNSFNGTIKGKGEIGRDTMQPIHDFVDRHSAAGTPFFIWYGVYLPHAPTNAPQKYRELFAGKGLKDYEIAYHANIAWLDDTIGDLIGYLDRKGLTENTVFLLVSDNGMVIDPDPWWGGPGGKTSVAEMGLRSPILVR
jgi:arylsulfatase A